jgi:transposase-like protein
MAAPTSTTDTRTGARVPRGRYKSSYSDDDADAAVAAAIGGECSIRAAARRFNVPEPTVRRHVNLERKGLSSKASGFKTVLTPEDEVLPEPPSTMIDGIVGVGCSVHALWISISNVSRCWRAGCVGRLSANIHKENA